LARERRGVVRRALASLPRPQRRAALLRFGCGLPFEAVAARLGTELATARTRVHRALGRLRARVSGLGVMLFGWPGTQVLVMALALVAVAEGPAPTPPRGTPAPAAAPARQARPSAAGRAPVAPAPEAASAQPRRAAARPAAEPAPRPQHFDFDDDEVTGDLRRPDGIYVPGEARVRQPSLIELRRDFEPELVKTLEEL
jgi:hypothetical protein